jgi:hypothetical protein
MPKDTKDNPPDFGIILNRINTLEGKARLDTTGDHPIRMHGLDVAPASPAIPAEYLGDIARIRMDDIPPKMKLSGETEPLGLDDDQGLGEIASFIYHPKTNILVMMRNRSAVSISGLCRYIETMSGLQDLQFKHVSRSEVFKRIKRLVTIKRFDLKLAAPGNGAIFSELGISTGDMIDLMNSSPHVWLTLSFSTGHSKKSSLAKSTVEKIAAKLKARTPSKDEIVSLVITGNEESFLQKEVIDLFEDVLTDSFTIDMKEQRVISDIQRHRAIKAVWIKNRDRIVKIFTPQAEEK